MENNVPTPPAKPNKLTNFLGRVKTKEKIFFIQNLKTMIRSGMSLTEALKVLSRQTSNKKFQNVLTDITNRIEQGQTLSQSLGRYPDVFSEIFINMIAAGETSGNLENILDQLYIQIKKDYELISRIRGAMTYPIVVFTAMIIMLLGMVFFVFPTFIKIFEEAHAELPILTRILINGSQLIINHWIILGITFLILIIIAIQVLKTARGKKGIDLILLKMPLIGPLTQKINLARFSRSISSLIKTDIPIIKSFEITASVVGNHYYKETLLTSIEKIRKGSTIADSLAEYHNLFPSMIIQMILVGEKSGNTDSVLDEIANFYEEEVNNTTKNLSSIIEPILILFIGVAVGIVAVAVMMPMYNLAQQY